MTKISDLSDWIDTYDLPASVTNTSIANPCGLIAKYAFSDEFLELRETVYEELLPIDDANITKPADVLKFQINEEVALDNGYWTNPVDSHLIVWYQMETTTDFIKLYGEVKGTLRPSDTYKIKIKQKFDAESIGTNKYLVF